ATGAHGLGPRAARPVSRPERHAESRGAAEQSAAAEAGRSAQHGYRCQKIFRPQHGPGSRQTAGLRIDAWAQRKGRPCATLPRRVVASPPCCRLPASSCCWPRRRMRKPPIRKTPATRSAAPASGARMIMPQTIEHLAIADLLGIKRGVVALSKVDMVSAHRCEEAALDIRERLNGTSLAGAEIQPVSAVTGRGIDALREKLVDAARHSTARGADGRFRLSVDRSFTLSGAGTVVTGTVLSGSVDVGAQVRISPSGLSARVRSIH